MVDNYRIGSLESVSGKDRDLNLSKINSPVFEQQLQESNTIKEVFTNLDSDNVDPKTNLTSIDFNTRLTNTEIGAITALQMMTTLRVGGQACSLLARSVKRHKVSLNGLGREEKVKIMQGEREHESNTRDSSLFGKIKGYMSGNGGKEILTDIDLTYFISTDSEKYKPPKNKTTSKEIKYDTKTYYSGDVAVTNNDFVGTESLIAENRLLAVDDYTVNEMFTVTFYTGTDGVEYWIYWYNGTTDNKTKVRREGVKINEVVSVNGFVTYQTEHFTTQTASFPDVFLEADTGTVNGDITCVDNYFTGQDPSRTEVSLFGAPSAWGDPDNIIPITKESFYEAPTDPNFYIDHYDDSGGSGCSDVITVNERDDELVIEVSVIVVDNADDYDGDAYDVYVLNTISENLGPFQNVVLSGEECTNIDADIYFNDYEVLNVAYTDNGAVSITADVYGTNANNYDTIDVYLDGRPGSDDVEIQICGNNQDFNQTFTITGTDHFSNSENVTIQVTVSQEAVTPTPTGSGVLSNGTLAYYTFDTGDYSGSTIVDVSGNVNGTVGGSATTGVTGKINEGIDMDGTGDYVTLGDNFDGLSAFTACAWFEFDTTGTNMDVVGKNEVFALRKDASQKLKAYIHDGSSYKATAGSTTLLINTWYHACNVYDGSTVKGYLNANQEGSSVAVTSMNNNVNPALIGNLQIGGTTDVDGTVDEVVFFDFALNLTQIETLYASGSPTTDQQYPYGEVANATTPKPSINFSFPDPINVVYPNDFPINMEARWNNEDNVYFFFTDPDDGTTPINITELGSYNGATFFASIVSGTLTISPKTNLDNLTVGFQACNTQGCNSTTSSMFITAADPPTQDLTFIDFNLEENTSVLTNLNTYFSDYNQTYITFTDPDNASFINITNDEHSSNSFFNISLSGPNLMVIKAYNETLTNYDINLSVCNDFGCVEESFILSVYLTPDLPPSQTSALPDVVITVNNTSTLDLDNYYVNATYYVVTFTNPVNNATIEHNTTGTHTNTEFSLDLVAGNVINFEGFEESQNNDITVIGCNVNGCTTSDTFVFSVELEPIVVPPTEPEDLDGLFDGIVGSTSLKTKLMFALLLIGGAFVFMFRLTESIAGGFFGAVLGGIFATVLGLISSLFLILVAVFALVIMLFMFIFGNKN